MTAYHPGDPGYDDIYESWIEEGQPQKLLVRGLGYLQYDDNGTIFFVYIDPADPKYLDPADKKRRWNRIYGYQGGE